MPIARKVILDVDPGIADALAMTIALFDPRLEVVAITATAGAVEAEQATRNVQAIIDSLDPPRHPRLGAAPTDFVPPIDGLALNGKNGLGDIEFRSAELHHQHPADKVLCDAIRSAPEAVTIIALGPLTNIARAMNRDPDLVRKVGQLIIAGGSVAAPGNASAVAEFNVYCDPQAARYVFRLPVTKTLIPLDVAHQVVMTYNQRGQLPGEGDRGGDLLGKILPFSFRAHHQQMGMEGIYLHEAVAVVAALQPELFEMRAMPGDVELAGDLTLGATVFDRRRTTSLRPNMDVAMSLDAPAVMDSIMRGIKI